MSEQPPTLPSPPSGPIPFPTLTIIYVPAEAAAVTEDMSQKYPNVTIEDCTGFFHGRERQYKKVTVWSQGIDSLWMNAIIAKIKEMADIEFITIVSGGMMHIL